MKLEAAVIQGDGVGPEMMEEAVRVLQAVCRRFGHHLKLYPVLACSQAIAAGKEGFVSMHRFVNPGQSLTLGRNRREFIELDKNNIDVETFDNAKRQIPGTKAGVAKETFRDLRCTLTEEQIKTEAKRCLGCGASVVDENKCIGCGICTTKCEFDAIHLTRDLPDASRMWKSEDKLKAIAPYALKRQFAIKRNKN